MANDKKFLPVRVVQPSRDFLQKNEVVGGSAPKWFIETADFESHKDFLFSEISGIETDLEDNFQKYPEIPSVIKAKLTEKAWAKSHRPNNIFDVETCPIIGLDHMGELLISATKTGLNKLKSRVKTPTTKAQQANITAVEELSKYGEKDKLLELTITDLMTKSKRSNQTCLKVILFDHHDSEINENVKYKFLFWIQGYKNLHAEDISKMKGLHIWRVTGANEQQIKEMISHPSIRTVSFFPSFRIILQKDLISSQQISGFPSPESNKEYPKIAVIDTGISKNHPFLSKWVIDRISFVPDAYQNNKHGSFVAGLICMGSQLNGIGICPDNEPVQIIDIQMIPDSEKDTVTEDILMERLESCVPKITEKHNVRIWNMSAGSDVSAEDEKFSSMAVFLDKLQEENKIILTLPSGNYVGSDQRTWPPQSTIQNQDRLQIPADSVMAMTVGAIACKEKPDSIVKLNQPASYSCRGPGPAYIMKPEIVHYSGNLTINNGKMDYFNQGILSFDEKGNIIEGIGTSYSCPLGARTMSIIMEKLLDSTTNNMVKALTIHNSFIPENLGKSEAIFPYVGFGKPDKVDNVLACTESEVTLMMEQEIYEGHHLTVPFAWPKSLIDENGTCRGKVRMTLVAGVPLDATYGSEYIRANVQAALQAGNPGKGGKLDYKGQLHEDPDTKDLSKCYEKERIKNGFKWKPIKRYEADLKGIKAEDWRIKISLLLRDGFKLGVRPVRFALVFSLSDPAGVAPVYNEVILGLRNKNVITSPIQLRAQVQEKVRVQ